MKTREARRIVVIADVMLKELLLEKILEFGAKGYNCATCFGKGEHEALGDLLTGRALIRIEVITNNEVAERILDFIHQPRYRAHALICFLDAVEVDTRDRFA